MTLASWTDKHDGWNSSFESKSEYLYNGHLSNLAKEVNDIKMQQRMVLKNLGAIYAPNKILSVALEK